ncbi:DNA replication and repair protein RecF [Chitinophaga sp. MM2321]
MNPDDPSLPPQSGKTHYAISAICLNTIRKYGQSDWEIAVENFRKFNSQQTAAKEVDAILRNLEIQGFKSIANDHIELGRVNVFIGANGSGKTNILEAIALAGAARANDLNYESFYSRGVRVARPDQIISSFVDSSQGNSIDLKLNFLEKNEKFIYEFTLTPAHMQDVYTRWIDLSEEEMMPEILLQHFKEITQKTPNISGNELLSRANDLLAQRGLNKSRRYDPILTEYAIFDINTKSLRGIAPSESKKSPLGINGEGLDLFIASLNKEEKTILNRSKFLFDWLDDIISDKEDKLKLSGLKAGKSISTLYFRDLYMNSKNNTLSAENSNEGILHILFYIALFLSDKTPKLFAIDNIETALNPLLCQTLIEQIVSLSEDNGKQVLITTHNPAILDGLNLFDDEQRLFEVFRDDSGHTCTRRIKFKSDLSDKQGLKLSDMWMSGLLGAVPKNF